MTEPLHPRRIFQTALTIVDEEGSEHLSMRTLATRLRVTPMAIYNHVPNKQALLDGVAALVMQEVATPHRSAPWHERLRLLLRQLRAAYLRHPHAVPLVQSARSTPPALLATVEEALRALSDAGLSPRASLEAWAGLVGLVNGFVGYQLNQHLDPAAVSEASLRDTPHLQQALAAGHIDWDRSFEVALRSQIDGLA